MTASTLVTLSARSTRGPVGLVRVPAVAPSWPTATMTLTLLLRSLAASAFTAATGSVTWKGGNAVGEIRSGRSWFEKPTIASLNPSNVVSNTFEGDHSGG